MFFDVRNQRVFMLRGVWCKRLLSFKEQEALSFLLAICSAVALWKEDNSPRPND